MFASLVPTPMRAGARGRAQPQHPGFVPRRTSRTCSRSSARRDNQKLDDVLHERPQPRDQHLHAALGGHRMQAGKPAARDTLDNVDLDGSLSNVYDQRVQSFFDMVVLAFKCDLVRSVSFTYDGETCGRQNNPCPSNLLYDNADLTGSAAHRHLALRAELQRRRSSASAATATTCRSSSTCSTH